MGKMNDFQIPDLGFQIMGRKKLASKKCPGTLEGDDYQKSAPKYEDPLSLQQWCRQNL